MDLPARIGKYELQEFLGGGMSHVYRASDTVIGRTVAVKILTEAGCEDAEAKARFLAEARMAGSISHDNVLGIYDFGEDEQHRPYMVMEFLRGESLRQAIKSGSTGDLKRKLTIALQVARALEYIQGQKIIHRDIKPENIHINTAGVVKLIDFGIAKTEGLSMTRAGYVLGTPYYMAPEQVMGKEITGQVDVYAFGVLLFELMTGNKPISGDTVERIFYSILNEPLDLAPLRESGAPESIAGLIARCTAKDPAGRPPGFAPICAELEKMIEDRTAPTVVLPQAAAAPAPEIAKPAPPPARRVWLLPVALVAVAALAAGLYFAFFSGPPKTLATTTGEMVLVPKGTFLFGEKKEPADMPAFYIDRTEVTNKAYAAFCSATSHALPAAFPADRPAYPVVNVSILDAQAFAKWAGKRLPTAREWEKAARGGDGRLYPWGNDADASRVNVGSGKIGPAVAFPTGASPYGVLQMAGNVWELVYDLTSPSPTMLAYFHDKLNPPATATEPWYVIRGESFQEPALDKAVLWDSTAVPARWKDLNIGFRCVKDL